MVTEQQQDDELRAQRLCVRRGNGCHGPNIGATGDIRQALDGCNINA
jgi:hypothetical protein